MMRTNLIIINRIEFIGILGQVLGLPMLTVNCDGWQQDLRVFELEHCLVTRLIDVDEASWL